MTLRYILVINSPPYLVSEPSDASVPKPSLRSESSLASLNVPPPPNEDAESNGKPLEEEEDLENDESAFDEEGILFGDSEFYYSNIHMCVG